MPQKFEWLAVRWRSVDLRMTRAGGARVLLIALAVIGVVAGSALPAHASAFSVGRTCRNVYVHTSIPSGPVTMYGQYCVPIGLPSQTLQLLVHGGTYNHTYWDFSGFNGEYSYVQAATEAGYATLAIDRLGYGNSTRPASTDVTFDNEVSTLHAVVQAVRSGSIGIQVRRIEGIGHSLGSGTIVGDAAAYPGDFDAIALTGYGQQVSPTVAQLNAQYFEPANNLPQFANLDAGYETNRPGTRGLGGLYYLPLANPAVVAKDQASEDTVTKTELASRPQGGTVQTTELKVPVLLADGQYDSHYCLDNAVGQPPHVGANCATPQAFQQSNEAYYPNACFATSLLNSGHDINLHLTAQQSFRTLLEWSYATVPPAGGQVRCAITGVLPVSSW
ncbi:MAG TPA: alpha/beta hydrolase [Candidatus Saccharimonadales bacterium]